MSKSEDPASSTKQNRATLALAIFVIALLVRIVGISWGLPNKLHNQSYHPDELVILGYAEQIKPAEGKFTPGFYNYGTLYLTALSVAKDMTSAYVGAPDPKDPASFWRWVGNVNLTGRILSSLAGAGMAVVLFLMACRFTSRFGAAFAGLLPAFAPGLVVHSRFQTVDVLAAFLLALSALFAIRFLLPDEGVERSPRDDVKDMVLAGLFAGLSAGTKYTGILALLTVFAVIALKKRPDWLKLGAIATGTALLAFVIVTPGIFLESSAFFRDFSYEMAHTNAGHGLVFEGTPSGFIYHLFNLQTGLGTLLLLVSLGGLIWAAARKQTWAIALLAFFIPYYILIGRAEVKFLRYTFPLYVGLGAGFGYALGTGRREGKWGHAVVALGILGIGGLDYGGLRKTGALSVDMARTDARDEAALWLKEQSKDKPSTTVGLVTDPWFYTPPLFPDTTANRGRQREMDAEMRQVQAPRVVRHTPADFNDRVDWDVRLLTEDKPDFVVVSNFELSEVNKLVGRNDVSESAQQQASRYEEFRKQLNASYKPAMQFGLDTEIVQDMMYVQPVVYVWKRKDLN